MLGNCEFSTNSNTVFVMKAIPGSIMTFFENLGACIFLTIPATLSNTFNLMMVMGTLLGIIGLICVKSEYKRLELEELTATLTSTVKGKEENMGAS